MTHVINHLPTSFSTETTKWEGSFAGNDPINVGAFGQAIGASGQVLSFESGPNGHLTNVTSANGGVAFANLNWIQINFS